ncbi:MAG: leucine-rich repeat protein [Metamycoplasmataceae bacterium]
MNKKKKVFLPILAMSILPLSFCISCSSNEIINPSENDKDEIINLIGEDASNLKFEINAESEYIVNNTFFYPISLAFMNDIKPLYKFEILNFNDQLDYKNITISQPINSNFFISFEASLKNKNTFFEFKSEQKLGSSFFRSEFDYIKEYYNTSSINLSPEISSINTKDLIIQLLNQDNKSLLSFNDSLYKYIKILDLNFGNSAFDIDAGSNQIILNPNIELNGNPFKDKSLQLIINNKNLVSYQRKVVYITIDESGIPNYNSAIYPGRSELVFLTSKNKDKKITFTKEVNFNNEDFFGMLDLSYFETIEIIDNSNRFFSNNFFTEVLFSKNLKTNIPPRFLNFNSYIKEVNFNGASTSIHINSFDSSIINFLGSENIKTIINQETTIDIVNLIQGNNLDLSNIKTAEELKYILIFIFKTKPIFLNKAIANINNIIISNYEIWNSEISTIIKQLDTTKIVSIELKSNTPSNFIFSDAFLEFKNLQNLKIDSSIEQFSFSNENKWINKIDIKRAFNSDLQSLIKNNILNIDKNFKSKKIDIKNLSKYFNNYSYLNKTITTQEKQLIDSINFVGDIDSFEISSVHLPNSNDLKFMNQAPNSTKYGKIIFDEKITLLDLNETIINNYQANTILERKTPIIDGITIDTTTETITIDSKHLTQQNGLKIIPIWQKIILLETKFKQIVFKQTQSADNVNIKLISNSFINLNLQNSSKLDLSSLTNITILDSNSFSNKTIKEVILPPNLLTIGNSSFSNCLALTTIIIPNTVTSIESSAFNSSGLTSIIIPDSVTTIGSSAFSNCSNLASITLPNTLKTISSSLFLNCKALTTITIPNTATSIESSAFNSSGLTSIIIPDSVTTIGSSAFSNCSNLANITLPNTLKTISSSLFLNCKALTTITIPNTVTSIESSAFNSSGLTSIIIPDSVTTIGSSAFSNCSNLASIILPNTLKTISSSLFLNCKALTTITIPNTVTSIESSAFNSSGLTSIAFPSVLKNIGENAFFGCNSLADKQINIPNSIELIGAQAFNFTSPNLNFISPSNLNIINYISGKNLPKLNNDFLEKLEVNKYIISKPTLQKNELIIKFNNKINEPTSWEKIIKQLFYFINEDTKIELTMPDEGSMFNNIEFNSRNLKQFFLTHLKLFSFSQIFFPNDFMTFIPDNEFSDLKISKLNLQNQTKLETIDKRAFYNCGITDLSLPPNLKEIRENAFSLNNINKLIYEPNTRGSKILNSAFSHSTSSLNYIINENVFDVAWNAFGRLSTVSRNKLETIAWKTYFNTDTKVLDLSKYRPNQNIDLSSNAISFVDINEIIIPDYLFILDENTFQQLSWKIKSIDLNNAVIIKSGALNTSNSATPQSFTNKKQTILENKDKSIIIV